MNKQKIKIATIDLYNNEKNEGMRCLKEIACDLEKTYKDLTVDYKVYETRFKGNVPDMDYDIYLSSGGPGSPFEGEGSGWEKDYFNLIDKIWNHNQLKVEKKKYIFFVCHSFQMMARYFEFGKVNQRGKKSFGVMPFSKTEHGKKDLILDDLPEPFYAADIRQYQVIEPNQKKIKGLDAKILSYEIVDDGKEDEPAIAAIRISDEIAGTQFHPEADPDSMLYHFKQEERKKQVVEKYGEARYHEMIKILQQPDTIKLTRETVIPSFLNNAVDNLTTVLI